MIFITDSGVYGPFKYIAQLFDRLRCDGVDFPYTVIGSYQISANDSLVPLEPASLEAKAAKNAQINEWRLAANQTTFPYLGKQIACDPLSRSDIDAVAGSISMTGEFPAGFPGAWKAVDNSIVLLPNVAAFKAMYAAMTAKGTENFNRSQVLKAALSAAVTMADVNAIVW